MNFHKFRIPEGEISLKMNVNKTTFNQADSINFRLYKKWLPFKKTSAHDDHVITTVNLRQQCLTLNLTLATTYNISMSTISTHLTTDFCILF